MPAEPLPDAAVEAIELDPKALAAAKEAAVWAMCANADGAGPGACDPHGDGGCCCGFEGYAVAEPAVRAYLAALPHLSRPATGANAAVFEAGARAIDPEAWEEDYAPRKAHSLEDAEAAITAALPHLNPGLPSPAREEIAAVMAERDAYLAAYNKAAKHVGEMNRERDRLREALRHAGNQLLKADLAGMDETFSLIHAALQQKKDQSDE